MRQHIRIIRSPHDVGIIIRDAEYSGFQMDKEQLKEAIQNWEKAFEIYDQVAYCIETGDFVAVVDKKGMLQVSIPEYDTVFKPML